MTVDHGVSLAGTTLCWREPPWVVPTGRYKYRYRKGSLPDHKKSTKNVVRKGNEDSNDGGRR